jgi:DNA replication and repair protein RecF
MKLAHIHVDGVRNLMGVELEPHPRLTVLVGDNGQGKTNLLEAIHLASALRPLRPLERAADLVAFGRVRGVVRARFELEGPLTVEVVVEPTGRAATIAGKSVRDVGALSSRIGVVSFLPEDSAMIRGGPEQRRRGLDGFAFSILPGFADVARRFQRALERRNRVLKAAVVDADLLESYDRPFAEAAAALTRARAAAVAAWAPSFRSEARAIGGDALEADMRYAPDLEGSDALADGALIERFLEELAAARAQELTRRSTAKGPHHDDVVFWKATHEKARFLASQGEARALVLASKIAAVRLCTAARGTGPLLLLDDVAGELDPDKGARLFHAVDDTGAQAFVTTTHATSLPDERLRKGDARIVTVRAGTIS